ncbi:MAG TPA: hypothetical protein VMF63_10365 [Opitutaceae bacterium]|nr:hypothetical protein [Opitutaceae bacterium]
MTRTLQSICRSLRASSTKAVQQRRCVHLRPAVVRWSKFTTPAA